MVLNWIWLVLVLSSVVFAAWTGRMGEVSKASLESAKSAIELVIGLTGAMIFFLGLVKIAADGGLMRAIVRALSPILRRLFPELPEDHPAMRAMLMNFAANILGLGNAATPFGLKAMIELNRDNPTPGSATNTMALFLAINTSSIVLLPPTGTVGVRLAAGSEAPFAIWLPTLFATLCSTAVAVGSCLLLQRVRAFRARPPSEVDAPEEPEDLPEPELPGAAAPEAPGWRRWMALGLLAAVVVGLGREAFEIASRDGLQSALQTAAREWLLAVLIGGFLLIGFAGRARVYDAMVEGGKDGLQVAVRIAPYLVAIMAAVGMFRASGVLDLVIGVLDPVTRAMGVPAEALPMALLRPLSGSGAFGVMAEIVTEHGPDSFIGMLASTLQGSTETTFYVLAVYLGAVGIRDARHILPACLLGDVAGFLGAVAACHFFFG